MRRLAWPLISIITLISVVTVLAATTYVHNPWYDGVNTMAQNSSETTTTTKSVGGHTPGYPSIKTSGDVLDPITIPGNSKNAVVDPTVYLRDFSYGHVTEYPNGTSLREFTLIASDSEVKEVSPGVFYNVWTFNGTIPGPTIRATEGDKIKINFINNGSKPHSIHTHGIHPAEMDGVFDMIGPQGKFTYEFTAEPYGVFPYHCHMTPLEEHITHGLYGVMIIDPKTERPPADELVMVMNGYDTDFDTENNFYTVNGIPYYYMYEPIEVQKDRLVRIYLVNMLEFDPINNFHLHANLFDYYPSGTSLTPVELNDIVTMSQGERGILEFTYKYPGDYMFHAHKTEFAEKGWMGLFRVLDNQTNSNGNFTHSKHQSLQPSAYQTDKSDNDNNISKSELPINIGSAANGTDNSTNLNENTTLIRSNSNSTTISNGTSISNGHDIEDVNNTISISLTSFGNTNTITKNDHVHGEV
jgi:manganese oxidase